MYGRTYPSIFRHTGTSSTSVLPQPLIAIFGEHLRLTSIISRKASNDIPPIIQKWNKPLKVTSNLENKKSGGLSPFLQPASSQLNSRVSVASSGITSYQQKEMTKPLEDSQSPRNTIGGQKMAMEIVKRQLVDMVDDIHTELDAELLSDSELAQLAK